MKKKTSYRVLLLVVSLVLGGCATVPPAPQLTPIEIQALQSREFETRKDVAFASTMSVFQDLGYIVESADKETGFITAKSAADTKTDFLFTGQTYAKHTKATAFVEEIRTGFSKIRLNFVVANQASTIYGQTSQNDVPILDAKAYEAAFEKISDAIFVRSGSEP